MTQKRNEKMQFQWPRRYNLLGVSVSATTYKESVDLIIRAAQLHIPAVVTHLPVHGVVMASEDTSIQSKIQEFQIVAPDGQPVRWALNYLYSTNLRDRVYGPELMQRLCHRASEVGIGIYLYGSTPQVVEGLRDNLLRRWPSLQIKGYESPPFRALTIEEDKEVIERINNSGAGLVFLGLGCPLQDIFAYEHRCSLKIVQLCVGAAFDFLSGNKKTAPSWMQKNGLEWLYRLGQEPNRLWRRYFLTNMTFLVKFSCQLAQKIDIRPESLFIREKTMKINLIYHKLIWKVREEGLLNLIHSMFLSGWRKFFQNKVEMVYIDCSRLKNEEYHLPEHLEVERYDKRAAVSPAFVEVLRLSIKKKYMQENFVDYYLEKFFELFNNGGVLWVAKYKKREAAYFWTIRGGYPTSFMFPISSRDADMAAGYTFLEYRGLGIIPQLYRNVGWQLGNEGVQRLYALFYVWNNSSRRALIKAGGYRKVGKGRKVKIAGRIIVIWSKRENDLLENNDELSG